MVQVDQTMHFDRLLTVNPLDTRLGSVLSAIGGRGIGSAVRPREGAGSETEGGSRSDVRTALKTFSPAAAARFIQGGHRAAP